MAGLTLYVRCIRCQHEKMFWARGLIMQSRRTQAIKLREIVPGFRCQVCRADEAVVSAPVLWV